MDDEEYQISHLNKIVDCKEEEEFRKNSTYKGAHDLKNELIWKKLENITVDKAVEAWIQSIGNPNTRKSYAMTMQELCKKGIILEGMSLQSFSMQNNDATVDRIKTEPLFSQIRVKGRICIRQWSEATRQQRAAAYVSFTGFLSRRTGGIIRKAIPCKEGQARTFYRISQHVKTNAFQDRNEWQKFFKELQKINQRDCLIGKIMLQGGKRISEALSLISEDINFEKGEISFRQAKTKGVAHITIITYRQEIMNELKNYISNRKGIVFITNSGGVVAPQQIERNFKKAGERAGISFKVTPHVLRATTVTYLKTEGFSDSDIMKVTGHADSEMIRMYDKSSLADNASKKINLI
jgi:integrase